MFEIIEALEASSLVASYETLALINEETSKYLKVKAELTDGSELWIRISSTQSGYRYSFHWQSKKGKLLLRWDNKPHYDHLPTYPHHKHIGSRKVVSSPLVTIHEVLTEIAEMIRHKSR